MVEMPLIILPLAVVRTLLMQQQALVAVAVEVLYLVPVDNILAVAVVALEY
jgi:hypothetical protein